MMQGKKNTLLLGDFFFVSGMNMVIAFPSQRRMKGSVPACLQQTKHQIRARSSTTSDNEFPKILPLAKARKRLRQTREPQRSKILFLRPAPNSTPNAFYRANNYGRSYCIR